MIFDRLRRSRKEPVSEADLALLLSGEESYTGLEITRESALGLSAVWACVRVISETLASLPLFFYERLEKGKSKVYDQYYNLLHVSPNPEQSAFQFKEQAQVHLCTYGNAYAQKIEDRGGRIKELWPLDPERMIKIERVGGQLVYTYSQSNGPDKKLTRKDVLHIPGLGYDGIKGYAPIELLKNEFGMALAAKRYGAEFYKNSGAPGGYIGMPNRLKDDKALKRLKNSWENKHAKWGEKHRVAILEDGAEWKSVTVPPEHAQFIQSMKFSTTDIARIYRVPPHLIADLERATFSNIEHQGIEFVVHTMRPWLVRWEQALLLQLLVPSERQRYFWEFSVDALLRGDIQARAQAYRTFREIGVMSANEIRSLENMNPISDGDVYYVPMNWVPTDQPIEKQEPEMVSALLPKETRQLRSATARHRISTAYERVFRDAVARIISKEARDIKRDGIKVLGTRNADEFDVWLDEYYRKLPEYIRKVITPVYRSLSEAIRGELSEEIDIDAGITPEDEEFVGAFVGGYIGRHIGKSRLEINKAIDAAGDVGVDPATIVSDRVGQWAENRPPQDALNETVRGSNAFAKNMYLFAGVLALRWVALGAKSCPFCQSMDGTVVSIRDDFAFAGENLPVGDEDMRINGNIGHPPLHKGCVCQIVAA